MAAKTLPGGTFTMAEDLTVTRMGYGAMQSAGPHVFGPPADRDAAVAVLREAIELGITHIDTSDYYGPHVTNQIIKEALHPYPDSLHIVTKVGALRDADGGWPQALAPEQLRQAVYDNLDNLGLDALDVVNLRVGGLDSPTPGSIAEPFTVLAQLQQEGLIKHLGLSTVTAEQIAEARAGVAAAALTEHSADPRYVIRCAPARQRHRCCADPFRGRVDRAEPDRLMSTADAQASRPPDRVMQLSLNPAAACGVHGALPAWRSTRPRGRSARFAASQSFPVSRG